MFLYRKYNVTNGKQNDLILSNDAFITNVKFLSIVLVFLKAKNQYLLKAFDELHLINQILISLINQKVVELHQHTSKNSLLTSQINYLGYLKTLK